MDRLSPDEFARIALALAATDDRAVVLASFGLDEARWASVEDAFQARLSEDIAAHPADADAVPPEVEALSRAFAREREGRAEAVLSFERYVELTRAMRNGDAAAALAKASIDLAAYLRAHEHWVQQMTRDPALAQRFLAAIG